MTILYFLMRYLSFRSCII